MNIITVIYRSLVSLQNTNICKNCYSSSYTVDHSKVTDYQNAHHLHAGLSAVAEVTPVSTKAP